MLRKGFKERAERVSFGKQINIGSYWLQNANSFAFQNLLAKIETFGRFCPLLTMKYMKTLARFTS